MRSYSASKVVSRLLSVLVLSGVLFGFVDSSLAAIWAQEADRGKIAYVGQDGNVWLVNADGTNARQITSDGDYRLPQWSKSGEYIGVVKRVADSSKTVDEIWIISISDFSSMRIVQFSGEPGNYPLGIVALDWLNDDTNILFSVIYSRGSDHAFYRVNVTDETYINFGEDDCACRIPSVSTDESNYYFNSIDYFRIAPDNRIIGTYLSPAPDPSPWTETVSDLVITSSDFSVIAPISSACSGDERFPSWSPNGQFIVYTCDSQTLHTLNIDTGEDRVIYTSPEPPPDNFDDPALLYTDWSPSGEKIVISYQPSYVMSSSSPDSEIWVIDRDGDNVNFLANGGSPVWQPAIQRVELDLGFRPDPTIWAQEADEGKIAYIGPDHNVWLVNADGSEARQVTFDAKPGESPYWPIIGYSDPSWSPDGARLYFVRTSEDWGAIVEYELQNRQERLVGPSGKNVGSVAVSPDGNQLAFTYDYEITPPPDELWVITNMSCLSVLDLRSDSYSDLDCINGFFDDPSFSPLGTELAVHAGGFEVAFIYVYLLDGSDYTDVGCCFDPDYFPDGNSLVVVWTDYYTGQNGLFKLDLATDDVFPLLTTPGEGEFARSPDVSGDGTRIAYERQIGSGPVGRIEVLDLTTGETRVVAHGGAPAWQPAIQRVELDLGFRPNPNGYHFQNDQFLRTQEMFEQFFGTENVRHPDGSWCEAAMQFFRGTHPDMPESWKGQGYRNVADGWSCVGFSLSSLLNYLDWPQPQAGPFAIAHYEQLYRHTEPDQFTDSIAYYSGVQTGKQYVNAWRARMDHCDTNPNRKIDDIEEGILNREPVIVLLNTFTGLGYHALVPYRVESVSSTETNIYVYDSEAPGEEHVIHFAHSGDEWHWTYTFLGSIAKAAGTATGQCKDIFLYPVRTSVEQGDPPVVFCESQGATSGVKALQSSDRSHRVLAHLPAEGDWVMRDNLGRRLGWVNGVLVSEIPDAFYVPQALGDVSLSYRILYLPEGEYTVELTDSPTDEFGYTLFGDGRFIEVAGHLRSPGSGVGLSITPGLDQARLSETQNLTSFTLTLDSEHTTESRVATVAGASLTGSGDLSVGFDGDQLMVSRGGGSLHYSPGLEKSDGQHFASEPLTLEGNETHTVSPIDWSELGSANVVWEIDNDSDGTIDETLVLEDRASVPMPTPTATVSPENGKGKGPCPGSLVMIGLAGLATLIGSSRRSMLRWTHR